MVDVVKKSVADVDAVLLLVEPIPNVGKPEAELIAQIQAMHLPAVLVINKIDTVDKPQLLAVMDAYHARPTNLQPSSPSPPSGERGWRTC